MTHEASTTLRFVGDWPGWVGVTAAVVLAAATWAFYRRDVRLLTSPARVALPALRASAVAMVVVMLSGPVLHHRKVIGQLSRLLLFIDGSRSMEFTDASMDSGRKVRILQRLGLLDNSSLKLDLPNAGGLLTEAQEIGARARLSQAVETSEWNQILTDLAAKIAQAKEVVTSSGELTPERVAAFSKELVETSNELSGREMQRIDDRQRAVRDIDRLTESAERWKREFAARFQERLAESGAKGAAVKAALEKFDTLPRWQRMQSMLIEGAGQALLGQLTENYDVRLLLLNNGSAQAVWQPTARDSSLPGALPKPAGEITDLATGIKNAVGNGQPGDQKGAIVVFSDGQHNEGESPVELAKVLGGRQLPVFTVGFGTETRPQDLAILKVEAPESAFFEDSVRGQIAIKDDMAPGQKFTVSIRDGDRVMWQQDLVTDGKGVRRIPFDLPLGESTKSRLQEQRQGVQTSSVPLELSVSISQVPGEKEVSNNDSSLRIRAVTQKRKILILDGRPRWETRYLRNLFERDEQWEVNTVIAGSMRGDAGLPRGNDPEKFPTDQSVLANYDLIIFGELARSLFKPDELQWLHDFVAQRGGAIIFVDGPRGALKDYRQSVLAPMLPVEWTAGSGYDQITKLALTDRSQGLAAFTLVPERAQNIDLWQTLRVPHWISGATALPGAEVLVEAEVPGVSGGRVPAVVTRQFGAGKVLYHAFDDSWRWRYEVADRHHVRYWNQIANYIAELPFAVRDKFISLDAGSVTYRPGDTADLRVRLRDGEGKPVTNAVVDAILLRDGKRIATIRLTPDDNAGGLFRGRIASLEAGNYEVGIESPAIAERDTRARTNFKVEPRETGELALLGANEDLLKQMAAVSGGQYLREEQIPKLLDLLAPLSQGRVIESDTVLWQSYWWFLPIVALLTIEWILRKRVGLL